ncbi:MAG: hypothetical protein OWS74_05425 [Firmicutes bacterium]|nr:hypothetical protein [Bacillota bacterium]
MAWYGQGFSQILCVQMPSANAALQEMSKISYPLPHHAAVGVLAFSLGNAVIVPDGHYTWIVAGPDTAQALYAWMDKGLAGMHSPHHR